MKPVKAGGKRAAGRRAVSASPARQRAAVRRRRSPAQAAAAPASPAAAELARLLELLDRSWRGPTWHGPAVLEALEGVTAAEAEARPVAAAHTIGELVLHMATWKRAVSMRLGGKPCAPSDAENFPPFRARDWKRALATLRREHAKLRTAFARLTVARLAVPAVAGGSPSYLQAHGVIHHDLWHAGQILVLRRALEGTRGRR